MQKLWAGRAEKAPEAVADEFNASIAFDSRMYREDILGSMAHARMLAAQGILSAGDAEQILGGLEGILEAIQAGELEIDLSSEDIHTFVETQLIARVGDAGKRLHTARSRNDQVALDLRLHLLEQAKQTDALLRELIEVLVEQAERYADAVMPGYTHMQRAQPVTLGHHLMAYVAMLFRDTQRLCDWAKRARVLPLGSAALAGTTYPIDRHKTAELLRFDAACENSMDGVSDRDFVIELAATLSLIMTHLSRFCEEIILWCSWEFRFIELDDGFSTGSSIMPQKKNPDMAELVRGKTGRVYGSLMTLLTMMKGIPLAYNKDMQEDKQAIFDAVDTVKGCLSVMAPMLSTMKVNTQALRDAASRGFINATDCADYLTKKGVPFRDAYRAVGQLVAWCIAQGKTLETLTLEEYQALNPVFAADVYEAIDLDVCVGKRNSYGGTSPSSVRAQVERAKERLKDDADIY